MIKIDVTRLKEPKGFIKLVIIFLSLVAWATLVGSFPCGSAEGTYQDIAHGEFFTAIHVMVWLEQLIVLGLYLLAYDSLLACRINWFLLVSKLTILPPSCPAVARVCSPHDYFF